MWCMWWGCGGILIVHSGMEPTFNTSFIPKEPDASASPRSTVSRSKKRASQAYGLGFLVAMLLALIAVLATAGILFYANVIKVSIAQKQEELSARYAELDSDIVTELRRFDARLRAAEQLAESHVAFSHFFTLLEQHTLRRGVRYTQMSFSYVDGAPRVALSGEAEELRNVALQMDAFRRAGVFDGVDLSGVQRGGQDEVSTFSITLRFPAEEISFLGKSGGAATGQVVDTPPVLDAIPSADTNTPQDTAAESGVPPEAGGDVDVATSSPATPPAAPTDTPLPTDSVETVPDGTTTGIVENPVLPPVVPGTAPGVPLIPLQ
jgi:hypothetical protein